MLYPWEVVYDLDGLRGDRPRDAEPTETLSPDALIDALLGTGAPEELGAVLEQMQTRLRPLEPWMTYEAVQLRLETLLAALRARMDPA
jgi:hypothetical protein